MDLGTAALPVYIASCMKVVNWRTPDFDRRCWTMVERLLSYSFCIGGLTPYVIDETFVRGADGLPQSPTRMLRSGSGSGGGVSESNEPDWAAEAAEGARE